METIISFFDLVAWFFREGVGQWIDYAFMIGIKWYTLAALKWKLYTLNLAFGAAQMLLVDFNFSAVLHDAFNSLGSVNLQIARFFRIPECLHIIMTAGTTKIVIRAMGW